jgi:hypothetical protein
VAANAVGIVTTSWERSRYAAAKTHATPTWGDAAYSAPARADATQAWRNATSATASRHSGRTQTPAADAARGSGWVQQPRVFVAANAFGTARPDSAPVGQLPLDTRGVFGAKDAHGDASFRAAPLVLDSENDSPASLPFSPLSSHARSNSLLSDFGSEADDTNNDDDDDDDDDEYSHSADSESSDSEESGSSSSSTNNNSNSSSDQDNDDDDEIDTPPAPAAASYSLSPVSSAVAPADGRGYDAEVAYNGGAEDVGDAEFHEARLNEPADALLRQSLAHDGAWLAASAYYATPTEQLAAIEPQYDGASAAEGWPAAVATPRAAGSVPIYDTYTRPAQPAMADRQSHWGRSPAGSPRSLHNRSSAMYEID